MDKSGSTKEGKLMMLLNKGLTLLNGIWAIPMVFFIRVIKPWCLVRIGSFNVWRIGHFAADVGQHHARLHKKEANVIDLYYLHKKTCNDFLALMVNRNFPVASWAKYLDQWNRFIPFGEAHVRPSTTNGSRDIYGFLEKSKVKMEFLPAEDDLAKAWLRSKGWSDGEQFVCLLVRDDSFLANDEVSNGSGSVEDYKRWAYHSYRNSDVNTYLPAMEWLTEQGVWVFRMGKTMKKPLPSTNKHIIDYAFDKDKSDFLDIWLFAHCNLCITTGSGPDMVSDIYRRPILALNFLPFKYIWSWSNALHAPKHLIWKESKKRLNWNEHLINSFFMTTDYENAGIEIQDLSANEILQITQESWLRILGSWKDESIDINNQEKFMKILRTNSKYHDLHNWCHPESRVSTVFIRNNPSWLQ
jgi:putative glycosyltransferase (TIGR04372 family)